jgi:hypothetical protein
MKNVNDLIRPNQLKSLFNIICKVKKMREE